jgi:hypothetical protein
MRQQGPARHRGAGIPAAADAALVSISPAEQAPGLEAFGEQRGPGFHPVLQAARLGTRADAFLMLQEPRRPQIGFSLRSRNPPLRPPHGPPANPAAPA